MIEVIQCRKVALTRARMLTEQDYQERGGVIETLEGPVRFRVGEYLCIGSANEEWPQKAERIQTLYSLVGASDTPGFDVYKPVGAIRTAMQMSETFSIQLKRGDTLTGKPGDYLLIAENGKAWPVARSIFEQSYERVGA